jgi:hypothetical protein
MLGDRPELLIVPDNASRQCAPFGGFHWEATWILVDDWIADRDNAIVLHALDQFQNWVVNPSAFNTP